MRKPVKNIGASVRARLLNLSKERGQPFELLLTRLALERFLYRLSKSPYRNRFILKGAMLLSTAMEDTFRPTRDLDLLGFGDSEPASIMDAFREICAVDFDDGVSFDQNAFTVDRILDANAYGGLRIKTTADVDSAKVRVIIDVGFGDAVEPGLIDLELPVLLGLPAPSLRAYPFETVIAEKFQAMVALGRANTRLKDFYDIWALCKLQRFDEERLARAIAATFARRGTAIPVDPPDALTPAFAGDMSKQRQWAAFIRDVALNPGSLPAIVEEVAAFLMPFAAAASRIRSR